MPEDPNYYSKMGIQRDATPEEIRSAYHQAALQLHPDVNIEVGETELFIRVQEAYDVLSDPEKRSEYDATLQPEPNPVPDIETFISYSRPSLSKMDEPQVVYALLNMEAILVSDARESPPLNVCLILDRSTSMRGERMDTVKTTAIDLIRQLRSQDILSLVTFSDRAEVLLPAGHRLERADVETQIQMIEANGGTEIYRGLEAGFSEVRGNLGKNHINHIILLTDGRTYGDDATCVSIAEEAAAKGIGISTLGIGDEVNDSFLDHLAALTGGSSIYVSQPSDIKELLKQQFNRLGQAYVERVTFDFEIGQGVELRYAFRLAPDAGPLQTNPPLHLGNFPSKSQLSILLEFKVPPISGNISQLSLVDGHLTVYSPLDPKPSSSIHLHLDRPIRDYPEPYSPPSDILEAMSILTLYRIQERARRDLTEGNFEEASTHLQNLATHLLTRGERELARAALQEAERLQQSKTFSEEGIKRIKYGTRALLLAANIPTSQSKSQGKWNNK